LEDVPNIKMMKQHNFEVNKATEDYMNAVVDPFGATAPARITDRSTEATTSFRDHYQTSGLVNNSSNSVDGLFVFLSYGNHLLQSDYSADVNSVYSLSYFGLINGVPDLGTGSVYHNIFGDNYQSIMGASSSYTRQNSLISGIRLVAGGVKVFSTTEVVTDASSQRVVEFIGGQMTPNDIWKGIDQSLDLLSTLRTSPVSQVYTNQDGVTVRWDPLQSERLIANYQPSELGNNSGKGTIKFDQFNVPCIAIQFKDSIAASGQIPVVMHYIQWLECNLQRPTPIYSAPAPVDPGLDELVQLMSACKGCYPLVAKGRTFRSFRAKLPEFMREAAAIGATKFPQFGRAITLAGNIGASLSSNKASRKRQRKQRSRGRGKRRQTRNVALPGTRSMGRQLKPVRNF
jgi:hypothetical protein